MPRSVHGGRHELGQNFLNHRPTIDRITRLVDGTSGPVLELGAGDGALTRELVRLGRPLTAIDIDEHRVRRLRRALPKVRIEHADATRYPLDAPVIAGNIPFHLTTPILRRLLASHGWQHAVPPMAGESPAGSAAPWQFRNPHVFLRKVSDVYGVQVLTGAHLAAANDLSTWNIEPIAEDRYLVSAHDVESWFDGSLTPARVEQARADFGSELLITEEEVRHEQEVYVAALEQSRA